MSENKLGQIFKNIADELRKKNPSISGETLSPSELPNQILNVGANVDYTFNSDENSLANIFSNISQAIRVKNKFTRTLKPQQFANYIKTIPTVTRLDTPVAILEHYDSDNNQTTEIEGYNVSVSDDTFYGLHGRRSGYGDFKALNGYEFQGSDINDMHKDLLAIQGADNNTDLGPSEYLNDTDLLYQGKKYLSVSTCMRISNTIYIKVSAKSDSANTSINSYKVTFKNGDTTLFEIDMKANHIPVYAGKPPKKDGYIFAGWRQRSALTSGLNPTTKDTTYDAIFLPVTPNAVLTIWKNDNGDVIEVKNGEHSADKCSITPVKNPDPIFSYEFGGWSTTKEDSRTIYTAHYRKQHNVTTSGSACNINAGWVSISGAALSGYEYNINTQWEM